MELENSVALITGGTAGIGLETARLLLQDGAEVVISGRDAARGAQAVEALAADTRRPGQVRFVQADLSNLASVRALAAAAGPVDVLVNNAGAFPVATTLEQGEAGFDTIFDTNVKGAFFLTAAVVPAMIEKGRGSIVNVTTMAAHFGVPGSAAYGASKAAMGSLTRTWAAEFGPKGIRVNSVAPGPTATPGVVVEWGDGVEELGKGLPLGRTARPQEIAEAIRFLVSPRASYLTGSTVHVDAGATAI